ncbi:MAG: hypothetical protein A2X43_08040 [Candidatus Margulisbacteria bacterium GWD2_39_127]|nr:MAG: hypothetical protein A2X43_08040 [Candidatus Margulisbacteria bacterium GWD2_39_127]OGI05669.1 MAG: hypothetical protein A2X41_03570 [Candidatus Margulisbacteria bacterium GWE2_39_32]
MQKVCDYSDTDYKKDFWGNGIRDYEDLVERHAVRRLLPAYGEKFLEIGGGFGRLMEEYVSRFKESRMMDYAANLVAQAQQKVAELQLTQVKVCQGNVYDLSEIGNNYDCCMMIRVMHHLEDVPAAFNQINKILKKDGTFILEYANKRNVLEILRMVFGKQHINPFSYEPTRRGEGLFYNFHPAFIKDALERNGFIIEQELMVSLFRSDFLKKRINYKLLSAAEKIVQAPLGFLKISPSVFIKARKIK